MRESVCRNVCDCVCALLHVCEHPAPCACPTLAHYMKYINERAYMRRDLRRHCRCESRSDQTDWFCSFCVTKSSFFPFFKQPSHHTGNLIFEWIISHQARRLPFFSFFLLPFSFHFLALRSHVVPSKNSSRRLYTTSKSCWCFLPTRCSILMLPSDSPHNA